MIIKHLPLELTNLLAVSPLELVTTAALNYPGLLSCPELNSRFGWEPLVDELRDPARHSIRPHAAS